MRITKWEHACLDIELGGQRLIIDPSHYAVSLANFDKIAAVVVTHVHADHYDKANLQKIVAANPSVKILTTQEVVQDFDNPAAQAVQADQTYQAGPFNLQFFGGQHATILENYPINQNWGVLVNQQVYYPGDSLVDCATDYKALGVPVMAPWLKFSEAAAMVSASSAKVIFPMHNGFVNDEGQALYDRLLGGVAKSSGQQYQPLAVGDSFEIL
ncbi:MAG: MBL fold metallo-hydrolase [Candidatus Saccharimonadales bacterium]